MAEKKRLTLTGNKMPEKIYNKLEELGSTRRLTPYIVSLVEKEKHMDELISSLSIVINKLDTVEEKINSLNMKIESTDSVKQEYSIEPENTEIKQGDLNISDKVIGGIEEEIEDMDF